MLRLAVSGIDFVSDALKGLFVANQAYKMTFSALFYHHVISPEKAGRLLTVDQSYLSSQEESNESRHPVVPAPTGDYSIPDHKSRHDRQDPCEEDEASPASMTCQGPG